MFAGLLFSTGAFGDRFGRKGALQFGLVGFLIGAALASMSTQMWQLIGCRALMGAAAAFIMPSTLSIIVNVFPPDERTRAIAIWAATTGAAGAIGPVASGWLLVHFWYGSVFLVNVPIVVTALVLGYFLVPKSRDPEEARLDPVGAVLSIVGVSSLVYGLIEAPANGWSSSDTLIAFAIAFVVLGMFAAWELRVDEPMLDLRYFRNPAFSTGTTGMVLVFMAMFGVMFLITQYFQLVLDYSPLEAALRLVAHGTGHDHRGAAHAPPQRALRREPGGRGRARHRDRRAAAVPPAEPGDGLSADPVQHALARDGHRAHDVADDGGDHVGGTAAAGRGGLGHERRDPRAGRVAGHRRARQPRRDQVHALAEPRARPGCRARSSRRRAVRWPAPSVSPGNCPARRARRSRPRRSTRSSTACTWP